jgi:hypothetical protein
MQDNLEQLKSIYLADDVDAETRADNLALITSWQKELTELDEYASWQEHDVTKRIIAQAKKSYVDHSLLLARSRELTDTARFSLWAKQDAVLWLISLASRDVKKEIAHLNALITRALSEA